MIMVDAIRTWPGLGGKPGEWCHMTTDTSINELHDMAKKMGVKRCWFHSDHYDLRADMREKAISLGAKPVPWRFMLKHMIKSKKHQGRGARA